ncbi:MAG: HNH endonuclease [Deltaproteobacteria bacterium]|nr:HNH endonuclease [Deltaproteobacteria bacterium]
MSNYPTREPFVANTDREWFDFLSGRATGGRVDEVNFWLPKAVTPMRAMRPGEPVFFRLKKPDYAIAGYGFFAHFEVLDLHTAWATFGWKNGDPDKRRFFARIGGYRGLDLLRSGVRVDPLGCTVLREATFWPEARWIPWGADEGWAPNIVQGKTERDPARVELLTACLREDSRPVPEDLVDRFVPLEVDARELVLREVTTREGQGAFRLRLMRAYDGQCAITGEHTAPVLDAAHIQPYLGPGSNHVQNGLLLTKEFHALFDEGYVGVTPDYEVRVSDRLRADYQNGRRYYPYDKERLIRLPDDPALAPSRDALAWHFERVFKKTG